MPAKAKTQAQAQEKPVLPRIGEREVNKLAPVFDAAEVKATFAAEAKAGGEAFADPDFAGDLPLPTHLETVVHGWTRGKALAAGRPPCVVELSGDANNPRILANGLVTKAPDREGARQLVEWLCGCVLLIAEHSRALAKGDFLWELIWPQNDAGVPQYSEKGRYVVRLYDHGQWRAVTVDDRVPVDAAGQSVLPTTHAPGELWPMVLCKAMLKLGLRTAQGVLPGDASVLAWLTGWLPEAVRIDPERQPTHLVFDQLHRAVGASGVMAALHTAGDDETTRAEAAADAGLRDGVLVMALEARTVPGGNFVRLKSELLTWTGPFCDTDEKRWTKALDEALHWKRRQRLRKSAAGAVLPDFWTSEIAANLAFSELLLLRDPAAWAHTAVHSGITYVPGHDEVLLHVLEDTDVVLALTVSPAGGVAEAPCWAAVGLHRWDDRRDDATLVQVEGMRIASVVASLRKGAYRIAVHSATELTQFPTFFHSTVQVCANAAFVLGNAVPGPGASPAAALGGWRVARLDGPAAVYNAVEKDTWAVLARARLYLKGTVTTPDAADALGRVPFSAEVTPHEEAASPHLRLHFVDNDNGCSDELSFQALRSSQLKGLPGSAAGYTLLVEAKAPVDLHRGGYTLDVAAPCDVDLALEAVQPPTHALGRYVPSYAHTASGRHVLFRYACTATAKSHAMVRLELSDPDAEVTMNVWRHEKQVPEKGDKGHAAADKADKDRNGGKAFEPNAGAHLLKSKTGSGIITVAAVPLELPEGSKGASGARIAIEATVSRAAVERLGLLREPRGSAPDPRHPLDSLPQWLDPATADAADEAVAAGAGTGAGAGGGGPTADAGDKPRALTYKLSAISDAAVTLTADEERERQLDAIKAQWEQRETGRRDRGRLSRVQFLEVAGAISASDAEAIRGATSAPPPAAKGSKGGAGAKPGSKSGSRAGTPANGPLAAGAATAKRRAMLWREPLVEGVEDPAHPPTLLGDVGRDAVRKAAAERTEKEAAIREALFRARGEHAAPRNDAATAHAQAFAEWRSEVTAQGARDAANWEALRLARAPEPEPEPQKGKGSNKKKSVAG